MNKNILLVSIAALLLAGAGIYALNAMPGASSGTDTATDTTKQTVTSGENSEPGSPGYDLPIEPAAVVARKDLATKLGLGEGSIVILRIEEKTWSDGCLGLARTDEFCSQALVDGFRIEMLAKGTTYFYRTDATGASVRQEPQ